MTKRPTRVVFAIPEMGSSGPDRSFHGILSGLDRDRVEPILVVGRAGGRYFDALEGTLETIVLGGGRYPARRLARAIDRLRPDAVLATLRMNATAAAARSLQRHPALLIGRPANSIAANFAHLRQKSLLKHRLAERLDRWLMSRPDVLVAQSSDLARELRATARLRQRVVIIGNPISLDATRETMQAQKARGATRPAGSPAIVSVGRLDYQKGYDLLLPAFAHLRASHGDSYGAAELTILGTGPDATALRAQAADLGIAEAVHLQGSSDTALAQIAMADLFISSSRYEGLPNVVMEAMALDTPVAATDCPGTRDLVVDGVTGFTAASNDADGLAEAMVRALGGANGPLRDTAREMLEKRYAPSVICGAYSDLFESTHGSQGDQA